MLLPLKKKPVFFDLFCQNLVDIPNGHTPKKKSVVTVLASLRTGSRLRGAQQIYPFLCPHRLSNSGTGSLFAGYVLAAYRNIR